MPKPERTLSRALAKRARKAGWHMSEMDNTIRSRIYHVLSERGPWWDWGRRVMWLVGRNDSGSAGTPRGRDLWYVHPNWLERWQQPLLAGRPTRCGFYTTTSYSDDVSPMRDVPWKIFDLQDDGHTLLMGWYPQPGSDGRIKPASIEGAEVRLFWRWYWIDHRLKAEWLGIRPWFYSRALHATVHLKRPFACNLTPPRGAGGYDHWHCHLPKRHKGEHRFRNYTWANGEQVEYAPEEAADA